MTEYVATCKRLAEEAGCEMVNGQDLKVGDRFRLFQDVSLPIASLGKVVIVWDGIKDGFGWGHTNRVKSMMFTGEDLVARIPTVN